MKKLMIRKIFFIIDEEVIASLSNEGLNTNRDLKADSFTHESKGIGNKNEEFNYIL